MKQESKRTNNKGDARDKPDSPPYSGRLIESQTNQKASKQTNKERRENEESPELFWINRWSREFSMWERIKRTVQRPDWWMVIGTWGLGFFAAWTLIEIHRASTLDQRAWVGVISPSSVGTIVSKDEISLGGVNAVLRNSGKTPALKVNWTCCIIELLNWNDPIPDYDVQMERDKQATEIRKKRSEERDRELLKAHPELADSLAKARADEEAMRGKLTITHTGLVLAPEAVIPIGLMGAVSMKQFDTPKVEYILGKVTYEDAFGRSHITKFCVLNTKEGTSLWL